jgi:hypothetical protein
LIAECYVAGFSFVTQVVGAIYPASALAQMLTAVVFGTVIFFSVDLSILVAYHMETALKYPYLGWFSSRAEPMWQRRMNSGVAGAARHVRKELTCCPVRYKEISIV